jgi:hypothetical protein
VHLHVDPVARSRGDQDVQLFDRCDELLVGHERACQLR